ncbi:MAG: Fe-S cluster assembly protein SufD [Thermoanaerobaculia bacterium]|nr:Fe-S cluster assembly protein SufD [Thermoanaerobaculia bacterium]
MTLVASAESATPALFEAELATAIAASQPEALRELRQRAARRFAELGLPTSRLEEWRFTNVAPVAKTRFAPAPEVYDRAAVAAAIAPRRLAESVELVFVDGRFAAELSTPETVAGLEIASLAELANRDFARLAPHLGRHASFVERPFAALSTARFEDGAAVFVARGAAVERPVHLLFHTTAAAQPTAVFPRVLVVAAAASRVTVVETYTGDDDAVYLVAPVTEIVAGDSAVVDHYKLQRDGGRAFHLSLLHVESGRAANVSTQTFSLGAAIARHDVEGALVGEGSETTLNGLYLVRDRQVADFHMRVDHAAPHTTSHELFKGVLNDRGRGVFNGRIHVHRQAQKTDAKQTSRNLLLSDEALVNANPQLEIFADDVRCTHGSTVGQLDDLAVFYLRSRGIGLEAARSLLTYAFASDLIERVKVPAVHAQLQEFLLGWIPQGEIVREAI